MKTSTPRFICALIFIFSLNFGAFAQLTDQTSISLYGASWGSVNWGDYNNDGYLDLLVTGDGVTTLYKNNGDNTFTEQTGIVLPGLSSSAAAWGDYNNDGYLDIVISGYTCSPFCDYISKVFKNNGDNTFTEQTSIVLAGVSNGSVSWGDYNRDGLLDLLISGYDHTGTSVTKLYKNRGDNTFMEQTSVTLQGVSYGSVEWGDYNNDGYPDILISGNGITKVYENNGDGTFTDQALNLPGNYYGVAKWGDYNNDGLLDILIEGWGSAYIYKNNGDNTFTNQSSISLIGLYYATAAWVDYNNDGNLDIIIAGDDNWGSGTKYTKIYKNNGNNTFTDQSGIVLNNVYAGSVSWGDYNNDGTLDLALSGYNGSTDLTKIYLNGNSTKNVAPATPAGLTSTINGNNAILKWQAVTGDATPPLSMSYNVRVDTSTGGEEIVPALADLTNGYRRIPTIGNSQIDTFFVLNNLKKGTYYWSVQAVDNGYAGGGFATEKTFSITADIQASNIQLLKASGTTMALQWTRGTGQKCVVFVLQGNQGTAAPVNNTTYTANPSLGSGTQIGTSGWFCVFNGNSDTTTISNLKPLTDYLIQVVEYSGSAGNESYLTAHGVNNPVLKRTNLFSEQTGIPLPGAAYGNGKAIWVDFNNDGNLDLFYTGNVQAKLFMNNGNNTFTEVAGDTVFQAIQSSSGATWGDYDNDGNLDVLITGNYYSGGTIPITRLYRNNGDGTFTWQSSISLTPVYQGSAAFGDYNNDGLLDILLYGQDKTNSAVTKIFRNTGNNSFIEQTGIVLPGLSYGSAEWGDYNRDGYLDILLAGSGYTKVFKNNGNNTFTEQTNMNIYGTWNGVATWGDYDNDGFLDILISGSGATKVFRNTGNNNFIEQTGIVLSSIGYNAAVTWGDYNNDGNLDIILSGYSNDVSNAITKLYRNNGDNTFTEESVSNLVQVQSGSMAWGDYDNDGDMDLLITGYSNSSYIAKVYRNGILVKNTAPTTPTGLTAQVTGNSVGLTWNPSSDDLTPARSMSYNLRVGTTASGLQITSPQSASNGFRRLASIGNDQLDSVFILNNLKKGTYYWSVQAVDNGLAGSTFATEHNFTVSADVQASNIQLLKSSGTTMLLQWTRGDGENCIVFMKATNSGTAAPVNNTTYSDSAKFGNGSQIGSSGWYCMYKGTSDTLTVNGLTPLTDYSIQVFEYSGSVTYLTIPGAGNPVVKQTALLSEISGLPFVSVYQGGSISWGDYNNDGYLDVLIYANNNGSVKVYKNNGDGTFAEENGFTSAFSSYSYGGKAAWVDYNNDGLLDVFITGQFCSNSCSTISKLYKNNGGGSFTEQTSLAFPGLMYGSISWGDYNNDGYSDLVITGSDINYKHYSKIFTNNAGTSFTELTGVNLIPVNNGSCVWGDYNNDGYLDILLTGYSDNGYTTKLYKNNGDNTFTEQNGIFITPIANSSVAFGDYNSDGYLDIVISGDSPNGPVSKIYKNNGNGTFTEQTSIILTGVSGGTVAWGDYDNDGYLDLLINGQYYDNVSGINQYVTKVYKNIGGTSFAEQTNIPLTKLEGPIAWADFDNDNDLDIMIGGYTGSSSIIKLYKNEISAKNTAPAAPSGLSSAINGGNVTLQWNRVTGDATPSKGLSYNVRIGSVSDSIDILNPLSTVSSGFRKVVGLGNTMSDTFYHTTVIKKGTYFWSVQSIDNSFAGGAFATEQNFSITANLQAFNLIPLSTTANNLTLVWNRGNGTKNLVFVKKGAAGTASPTDDTTYVANTIFGSGSQIGSTGWYCVYNGTSDTVTVQNLDGDTQYKFQVFEYEGSPDSETYYTSTGSRNPLVARTGIYQLTNGFKIKPLMFSAASLADIDNDGELDVVITGQDSLNNPVSRIYRNNGNHTFDTINANLPQLTNGSVAWGDLNNDGNVDLIITGLDAGNNPVSKVYHNNGNGTFSNSGIVLPGVGYGSVAIGDYNNDGLLDFLLSGQGKDSIITKLYQNKGDGTFMEQIGIHLPGIKNGSVAWGDYNRDGYLDILISGDNGTNPITKILRNNGNNTFSDQITIPLIGVKYGAAVWGDYNNDGFLDILLAGQDQYGNYNAKVFKNNRDNTFSSMDNFNLNPLTNCTASWGDYNNDGRPDILLSGQGSTGPVTQIYLNTDTAFILQSTVNLKGLQSGFALWGDFNTDGGIDILESGSDGINPRIRLYLNKTQYRNIPPPAPTGLTSVVNPDHILLGWNSVTTDDKTPTNGLSYNIKIGKIPGALDVISPQSAPAGQRKIVGVGNGQTDTTFIIKNLQRGPYYWSVQAVDNGYMGGSFSSGQQFLVTTFTQASDIQFLTSSATSLLIQWTRGNGQSCLVFAKQGSAGTAAPEANTDYIANQKYGLGSQISSTGWYCVYNGIKDTVTVTNLKPSTEYIFQVFEYEGSAGIEYYFTNTGLGNPATKQANLYSEQRAITFPNYYGSKAFWGDYNNDGFLDILMTYPNNNAQIFKNNGNNTFSLQAGIILPQVGYGAIVLWGDYNNDGYLDILMSGEDCSSGPCTYKTRLFKNNGNNTFTEQTSIVLPGVAYGSAAWGDYNNDGFPDLILAGQDFQGNPVTKICRNNGDNTFTIDDQTNIDPLSNAALAWGDYDKDGFLDLIITGTDVNYNLFTKIYRNNGDYTFSQQSNISIPGVQSGSVAWGDYDNDGYLDILISGYSYNNNSSASISKIFRNDHNNNFVEQTGIVLPGVQEGSASWGDYDNNGTLDILLGGYDNNNHTVTKVFKNNGNNSFTEQTSIVLPGTSSGSAVWGDYNNDRALDLLLAGYDNVLGYINNVYKNEIQQKDTLPAIPSGLSSSVNGNTASLNWKPVKKTFQPGSQITYNLRVGKTVGGKEITSPSSSTSGYRRIPAMGNDQLDTVYILQNLKKGQYYWSVQAVDGSYFGGAFAGEKSFTITTDAQASKLRFPIISANSAFTQWNRGTGTKCIVFAKQGSNDTASPVNNTTYNANTSFGLGDQIGSSGWYCIYNGSKDSITIQNLTTLTPYVVQVFDYDGVPGSETYYSSTGIMNPAGFSSTEFAEQKGLGLAQFSDGQIVLGDYNNDGFIDILAIGDDVTGKSFTKIYRSNGDNTFSEQTGISLPGISYGSVAWGDYNNDGNLDILLSGYNNNGNPITKVFRNNGDNSFSEQTLISLAQVAYSKVAWADFNNDGWLDIIIYGYNNTNYITKIYLNNGDNTFTEMSGLQFNSASGGGFAVGDYNNDGYLDILHTGYVVNNSYALAKIFKNNGDGTFTEQPTHLVGGNSGSVEWGDYNNDGLLDILMTGYDSSNFVASKVFKNNGDNTFTEQSQANLAPTTSGSAIWGDYNNDGQPDILLTGYGQNGPITKVYRNDGNGIFTETSAGSITGVSNGGAVWGDYNNDGNLDIIFMGSSTNGPVSKIYLNQTILKNQAPPTPTGLQGTVNGNTVNLIWNKVNGDNTPAAGMSYNIKVGLTSGGVEIASPGSAASGFRRTVSMGNVQLDTAYQLNKLRKGTYYWSLQAVDNGYMGSPFSAEQSFNINSDYQASNVQVQSNSSNTMVLQWSRGSGDACIVFLKKGVTGTAIPVNNTTYAANASFGSGTQLDTTAWYCVYKGKASNTTISNLEAYTDYIAQVIEFTGTVGNETYLTLIGNQNPAIVKSGEFSEVTNIPFIGMQLNSLGWADYNNDGNLDLLLAGQDTSHTVNNLSLLYKNNPDHSFALQNSVTLTGLRYSSIAWADYNNDGYLDLLLTGYASTAPYNNTKLYRNNGDNTFSEQTSVSLPGVRFGSVAWGDYNNDGKPDILLSGYSNNGAITKLFKNAGNNSFVEQAGIILEPVYYGSVSWADLDNDGYLDIIITGYGNNGYVSKIYRNNGDNSFTEMQVPSLIGFYLASVALGDYNNDGLLDILISGYTNSGSQTNLYMNEGNFQFSLVPNLNLPGIRRGTVAWGDYDNDGNLDILLSGFGLTKVFRNNGDNTFSERTNILLPAVSNGKASWVDYNNDGTLDILVTGMQGSTAVTRLFRNDRPNKNVPPSAPTGLSSQVSGNQVNLSWSPAVSLNTASNALTYNLRVGTASRKYDVMSPQSDSIGFRRLVDLGNTQLSDSARLDLPKGQYYWSVQAVDNNFAGGPFSDEQMFTVSKRSPKVFWSNPQDINYGTALSSTQLNATANIQGNLIYTPAAGTILTGGLNEVLSVQFVPLDTATFVTVTKKVYINVMKFTQTIAFGTLAAKTYGNADFDPSATASSGLTVTYSSSNLAVANIVNGKIHLVGAGNDTITAMQPGDLRYIAAANVSQTLAVNKQSQHITFNAMANMNVGVADFNPASVSSGLTIAYRSSVDSVATIVNGKIHVVGVGTTSITASQPGNAFVNAADSVTNTLTIQKANQVISFPGILSRNFGDPDFTLGITASSGLSLTILSSDTTIIKILNGKGHIMGAGSAQITASQGGNKNYNAAASVSQSVTVNKGNQTITFSNLQPKNYGDADFDPGATSTSELPITYSSSNPVVATIVNGMLHITGAWVAEITAAQAGNSNYNSATSVTQLLIVNKANQTITFAPIPDQVVGGTDFDPGATSTSGLAVSYLSSNPAVAIILKNKVHLVGAGSSDIVASQNGNGNYNAADDVIQTLTAVATDVADLVTMGIRIYPNPAKEKVYVEDEGLLRTIELVNILGRSISITNVMEKRTEVDLTSLPSGVYFIRLTGKDFRKDIKLIVNK